MHSAHTGLLFKKSHSLRWLNADVPAVFAYALALLSALAFLAYMFPLAFFQGDSTIFDFGDNAQHVSGWLYYAKDTWHFPLLYTNRVDHPEGLNIAFTDSIPLAALFFKALMTALPNTFPAHFHYFGWWVGLVFVTQALSATLLIRALGAKSIFATALAVVFALTWPVIHVRYSHAALMMHSIIIFALALYFLGMQQQRRSTVVATVFIALNIVALLVHPYFLPFTTGLFVAFMVDQALQTKNWGKQAVRLLVFVVVLGAVGVLMGYFGHNTFRGGYGEHFNFNLAAPFCGNSRLLPCEYGAVSITKFEGFNYFGAGFILLLPFALYLNWRNLMAIPKRYPAFILTLFGLFLYAVTNHVWLGPYELLTFPIPSWLQWLTGTYRAAGRFFWIIGYLTMVASLAVLAKRKSWSVALLLAVALVVQIKDVKPWLTHIKTEAAKPSSLNYADWEPVMAQVDKIVIYPTFDCGPGDLQYYTWTMQLAAYYGKLLNSGYTSRDKKDCPASELAIQEPFQARHLYVISTYTYYETPFVKPFAFPVPMQQAINRGECVKRADGLVCLPGSTAAFWQSIKLNTYPVTLAPRGIVMAGPEMTSQIGVPNGAGFNARLVPKDSKQAGWLSFGPSLPLPVGRYEFTLTYVSNEKVSVDKTTLAVGNWDVVLQQGGAGNEKFLFSGKLMGTSGATKQIEGVFAITPGQESMPLEIRTFFLAQGDLQLVSTSLVKLP
jgi:Family of unknown function (DUF6311)